MLERLFCVLSGRRAPEEKERQRVVLLKQLLALQARLEAQARAAGGPVAALSREFLLDALTVAKRDGTVVASDEEKAFELAVKNSSILQFVQNEYPKAQFVVVKQNGKYNIIWPEENELYIMKSSGEIPSVETRVIIQKLKKRLGREKTGREKTGKKD